MENVLDSSNSLDFLHLFSFPRSRRICQNYPIVKNPIVFDINSVRFRDCTSLIMTDHVQKNF